MSAVQEPFSLDTANYVSTPSATATDRLRIKAIPDRGIFSTATMMVWRIFVKFDEEPISHKARPVRVGSKFSAEGRNDSSRI